MSLEEIPFKSTPAKTVAGTINSISRFVPGKSRGMSFPNKKIFMKISAN
jgi:hypothetical protein